jgi:hypothetical protein
MMRPSSVSTFITRLAWAGIALNKVKRLLGYKSPMMTLGWESWIGWPG